MGRTVPKHSDTATKRTNEFTMKAAAKKTIKQPVPLPKLLKKAQDVFNCWIRNRDFDKGCISCNSKIDHAGHYFSQGHHSALRYNEMNTNGQCLRCNNFLSGNLINYRSGLVKKYGEQKVLMLENCTQKHKKWSRFELEAIIQTYKL